MSRTHLSRGEDIQEIRRCYGRFPTGVVCALVDDQPSGLAAGSFTSESLDPPLVSLGLQHTSETWPRAPGSASACWQATTERSARNSPRKAPIGFAGVAWSATYDGAVLIEGPPRGWSAPSTTS